MRGVIDKFWEEWTLALREADPTRPELLAVLTGDAKQRVTAQLEKNRALDEIALRADSLPIPHKTLTVVISGDSATIRECVVDDPVLIERTTRETLNGLTNSFVLDKVLLREGGLWRVSESTQIERANGGALCEGA